MSGVPECPCCGSADLRDGFAYETPPEGETPFGIAPEDYRREYRVCAVCGHWLGLTELDLAALYEGDYVDATYSSEVGLADTFDRIMALPAGQSDNARRVARIAEFWANRPERSLLDVGSGLGVFPARMKQAGWTCTAVDPDERAVTFLRDLVGVEAVRGDFFELDDLGRFPLVTLNKVLEHVGEPRTMLTHAHGLLDPGGVLYVEVPDGERAAHDTQGAGREELFIEHMHVFSPASLATLVQRSGFELIELSRLREPSGKYTVYALCEPGPPT